MIIFLSVHAALHVCICCHASRTGHHITARTGHHTASTGHSRIVLFVGGERRAEVVRPLPGDGDLGKTRWRHAARDRHCRSTADVQSAVRTARTWDLPLSVRGGGHDWAGRSLCGGLVIDLTGMRRVDAYLENCTARIGGGARAFEAIHAIHPHGIAAVTGVCGGVVARRGSPSAPAMGP
jgi:FAD/FMN-containing dehydrogenase